jgi:hypothetical protein
MLLQADRSSRSIGPVLEDHSSTSHHSHWQMLDMLAVEKTDPRDEAHAEKDQTTDDKVELDQMSFLVPGARR